MNHGPPQTATPFSWTIIAAAGAATVLSYALMGEYFPKAMSGRANGALNLLHVGAAFGLQSATGFIIEQWPQTGGAYPAEAHQIAMAIPLALQVAAAGWFTLPRRRPARAKHHITVGALIGRSQRTALAPGRYVTSFPRLREHDRLAHGHAASWRLAAVASMSICIALAAVLSGGGHANVRPRVVEAQRERATTPSKSRGLSISPRAAPGRGNLVAVR